MIPRNALIIMILGCLIAAGSEVAYADRNPFEPIVIRNDPAPTRPGPVRLQIKKPMPILASNRIRLTGIIWDQTNPTAIITLNGVTKSVEPNDKIGSGTILSILPDKITIMTVRSALDLNLGDEKQF